MRHYFSATPASLQRRSRTFWVASWLLVVLYLVASGRAFIPGICATQRALDAQCAAASSGTSMHAIRACCAMPPAKDGESDAPVAPGDSGCALCKLVSSVAPLAATVHVPVPPEPKFTPPQTRSAQLDSALVDSIFQTRAPPLSTHFA
ncbi:MAG: hypothetical protein JNK74_15435 [Candidatus Hydrogenedentes bacterium]|nr:hypothetical protein [Candidatus Hydrogenedentota bacterium]